MVETILDWRLVRQWRYYYFRGPLQDQNQTLGFSDPLPCAYSVHGDGLILRPDTTDNGIASGAGDILSLPHYPLPTAPTM